MKAYEVIEKFGWCQGSLYEGDKVNPQAVCALGAIYHATTGTASPDIGAPGREHVIPALNRLRTVIGIRHIPSWNDDSARTKAEGVAILKRLDL